MRLLLRCLVAGIILILCKNANAQGNFSAIQGKVIIQNGQIKDAIALTLKKLSDTTIAGKTVLDKDDAFKFDKVKSGNYALIITCTGYQKYTSEPIQVNNTLIVLPPIVMQPAVTALEGITVFSRKDYIETRPDRTILNVEKGVVTGVSAMDILGTAPGVRVSTNGDILFKGGQKAGIAINGRLVNLGSQDVITQLQNMQSNDINQIELIQNPSAKYDAAGPGGLINIILKKGKNYGFNGSINEGLDYGNFGKIRSDINLNYRTRALNFFGMYGFGENNTDHTIVTNRYVGNSLNFDVNYYNTQRIYKHTYNFGIDYNIDVTHTLGVLVTGYFYNYFIDKDTRTAISNSSVYDSTLTTTSILNRRYNSIDYNLNYTGKLGQTNQTISADADYNIYNRGTYEDLTSTLFNALNQTYLQPQFFRNMAPTRITNLSGKIDYVNQISKITKVEAGLKSVFAESDNNQWFNTIVGNNAIPNNALSSQFNYTENITSAYTNYIKTLSKFNYLLGIRAEYTKSDANLISVNNRIKRNYTDLFPIVSFNYTFNPDQHLSLIYNRRINRPTYQELNPIIAYQDKYDVNAGNPYLSPSYTNKVELKHSYKNMLNTSLYASFTTDAFNFPYFSQNDATGLYITGKTNLKQVSIYGADINTTLDPATWWNINADADFSYQHFIDYAGLLNKSSFDALFKLTQQLQLPSDISVSIYGQYEVPTFYTIYSYKETYFVNASIRKQFMDKRAALGFTINDVFNTSRDRYSSVYANLNLTGYDKIETRIFRLSFSYAFGKSTVKASRRHVTGNNEEMNRLSL